MKSSAKNALRIHSALPWAPRPTPSAEPAATIARLEILWVQSPTRRVCAAGAFIRTIGVFPAQKAQSVSLLAQVSMTFMHLPATGGLHTLPCSRPARSPTREYRRKTRPDSLKRGAVVTGLSAPTSPRWTNSAHQVIGVLCVRAVPKITCACSIRAFRAKGVIPFWQHSPRWQSPALSSPCSYFSSC